MKASGRRARSHVISVQGRHPKPFTQPDIQASRFKSQVNSAKLLGRTGCEHYNTNPGSSGGSESTLISLQIGLLSLAWGDSGLLEMEGNQRSRMPSDTSGVGRELAGC